tara:strand:+ start:362 stop:1216 length:855 start_codon:yes stop_codon:yes gene_type:complete
MIYDTVISTGVVAISGCSSVELGTNTYGLSDNEAVGSEDRFFYDRSITTGQREMQLFLNGQTLLQEIPITGDATNEIIYQIETGDFFTKTTSAGIFEQSRLYFASNVATGDLPTPINSEFDVVYNVVTGGIFAGTGDLGLSLKSGISGQYTDSFFVDYDYFLNGQKVYNGVGVGVSVGVGATTFIPNFGVPLGGVVTNDNKNEFKYTAYRKIVRTHSITGSGPDIFSNTGFIEGRNNFYINGIYEPQKGYLELYTGVILIKSGLTAVLSGDNIMGNRTKETILL